MTKSITDLAREAGFLLHSEPPKPFMDALEHFAALHRASIIEELTGEMPEPVAWRCTNWSGSIDDYIYRDADDCAVNAKGEKCGEPLYTADQMREYAAAAVLKAVAAEREQCAQIAEARYQVMKETEEAHYRFSDKPFNPDAFGFARSQINESRDIADAIRARGNV